MALQHNLIGLTFVIYIAIFENKFPLFIRLLDFQSRGHTEPTFSPFMFDFKFKKLTSSQINPTVTRPHLGGQDLTPSPTYSANTLANSAQIFAQ